MLNALVRKVMGIDESAQRDDTKTDMVISNLIDLESRLHQRDSQTLLANSILTALNEDSNGGSKLKKLVRLIHEFTGNHAVGIRIQDGNDFPYYYFEGFSPEFIAQENSLCGEKGTLECMCGAVLQGKADANLPFFTEGGSFWTGNASALIDTIDARIQAIGFKTRQRCWEEGYESVVLIPLATGGDIVGLLQLNDKRKDFFSVADVAFFEQIGRMLGIGIRRMLTEDRLRHSEAHLKAIVQVMPCLIFRIKTDGTVLEAEGRRELFAIPPEEQVGKSLAGYLPDVVAAKLLSAIQEAHTKMQPVELRYEMPHPIDGAQTRDARLVKYAEGEVLVVVSLAKKKEGANA